MKPDTAHGTTQTKLQDHSAQKTPHYIQIHT